MKRFAMFLMVISSFMIASCNSRHVADKPDTARPTIVARSPLGNATGVPVNTTITVTFSEGMNASTINDASFYLMKSGTTTTITGTISYDTSSSIFTLTTTTLDHNAQYTMTVTTAVQDAAGNHLGSSSSWSFTTIRADHLDTTFNSDGKVRVALSAGDDGVYAATMQPGGEIITAGVSSVSSYSTSTNYFTIARFQSDGVLDASFSPPAGYGKNDHFIGRAFAVTLQSDNKILAAGSSGALDTSNSDFLIARYNPGGDRDLTFGTESTDGSSIVDNNGARDIARAVAIQADGKIIAVGESTKGITYQAMITRLTSTGMLDTSFGTDGIVTYGTYTTSAYLVKIQSDDKILVGGSYENAQGLKIPYLLRYDSSGALDPSFGLNGVVTITTGTNTTISGMELLPSDEKILIAGTMTNSTEDIFLSRFTTYGDLDTTFGPNGTGWVIRDDVNAADAWAAGLAIQSDGKIVVAARYLDPSQSGPTYDFALFRFNPDGAVDTIFGAGFGMVTTNFGSDDFASDLLIQQDGKIVVVGSVWNGSNFDIGLARYWP